MTGRSSAQDHDDDSTAHRSHLMPSAFRIPATIWNGIRGVIDLIETRSLVELLAIGIGHDVTSAITAVPSPSSMPRNWPAP